MDDKARLPFAPHEFSGSVHLSRELGDVKLLLVKLVDVFNLDFLK